MKPKADLCLPALLIDYGLYGHMHPGRQGGEAASTLHLLSACAENEKKKKKLVRESHAPHKWYSASKNFTTGLSVHSYSAPAARCQINCGSVCEPLHSAWLGCACRLIHVSQGVVDGVGGGYWKLLASTKTTTQQQPSPLCSKTGVKCAQQLQPGCICAFAEARSADGISL